MVNIVMKTTKYNLMGLLIDIFNILLSFSYVLQWNLTSIRMVLTIFFSLHTFKKIVFVLLKYANFEA